MKPNFALNITDTAISLLHRTSRGWLEVGSANFDAPDLEEALGYLRSSALGLSPHGITTKLILPPGQILYTEVAVTGADKAAREVEIRAALEGRTPYAVDDLVFDWRGTGAVVKVAVVARETLDEAEAFAEAHRFNPISFVTTPAEGQFAGEPWFGVAKGAAALLPEGEKVTRDQDPVAVISREIPKAEERAAVPAKAEDAAKTEDAVKTEAPVETDGAEKAPADLAKDAAEKAGDEKAEADTLAAKALAEAEAAKQAESEKAAHEKAEADTLAAEARAAEDAKAAEAEAKARAEAEAKAAADAVADAEAIRKTEAAKAEMERRAQELAQGEAKRLVEEAEKTKTAMLERERSKAALIEAERKRAEAEAASAKDRAEKAASAFAGVTDPGIAETTETAPPAATASFASRRREDGSAAPSLGPAQQQTPAAAKAVPSAGTPAATDPKIEMPADAPKGPAAPSITLISARGLPAPAPNGPKTGSVTAPTGQPAKAPAAAAPYGTAPKPLNGTAAFATGAKAEIAKAAPVPEGGKAAAKGVAAMVTAARIPGTSVALSRFKSKMKAKPTVQTGAASTAGTASGSALSGKAGDASLGKFGAKLAPRRGKPRFLGLILTLVLLAALAAIAAWSSIYLSRDDSAPQTIQQADGTVPAAGRAEPVVSDAEAAADAEAELPPTQDVAAEPPAPVAAPVETPVDTATAATAPAPTAPDTVAGDSAAQTDAAPRSAEDEIMLAAIDEAQPAFDAVALPRPQTRPDAAPAAVSPPPPFGTQYEFEPDGTIKATANGVVMPDGFWLIAARPPVLPPARPAAISDQVAAPPVAPDANAAATPPPDPAAPGTAAPDPAGASTAGISRMEGTTDVTTAQTGEGTVSATGPSFAFEQDATVDSRRPRVRPDTPEAEGPAAAQDDAALTPPDPALARLTSLRPRARPNAVVVAAEEARQASEAASLAATAAAQEKTRQDSALTVALSPRPAARPRDFSRAVEAAISAATREAPRRVASAAAPAPKVIVPNNVPEAEETDEPELKVSAAPRIPTRANVAKQATFKNAINLSKTNLIGVYGADNKRYALIRSSSGRYTKVRVGDKLDGGTVAAITRNEVRYQKRGKMLSLSMPKG